MGQPPRVLLIDPIDDDRELQAHILTVAGVEVLLPGDNPLLAATTLSPDAIIVDVSPRRAESAELVRRFKEEPTTSGIPVIVVSTYPQSETGPADAFLGKPHTPGRLLAALARVMKG